MTGKHYEQKAQADLRKFKNQQKFTLDEATKISEQQKEQQKLRRTDTTNTTSAIFSKKQQRKKKQELLRQDEKDAKKAASKAGDTKFQDMLKEQMSQSSTSKAKGF